MAPDALLELVLLYLILPMWLLAGFADALCHRVLHIERSAGWRESALHWLMLSELGAGVVALLLLENNALVIALFASMCLAHEVTMLADLRYAHAHRDIPPAEQWVHGILQATPWSVLLVICVLHPWQALALLGLGEEAARWTLERRDTMLPRAYLPVFFTAACLLVIAPFLAEAWRTVRVARGR